MGRRLLLIGIHRYLRNAISDWEVGRSSQVAIPAFASLGMTRICKRILDSYVQNPGTFVTISTCTKRLASSAGTDSLVHMVPPLRLEYPRALCRVMSRGDRR